MVTGVFGGYVYSKTIVDQDRDTIWHLYVYKGSCLRSPKNWFPYSFNTCWTSKKTTILHKWHNSWNLQVYCSRCVLCSEALLQLLPWLQEYPLNIMESVSNAWSIIQQSYFSKVDGMQPEWLNSAVVVPLVTFSINCLGNNITSTTDNWHPMPEIICKIIFISKVLHLELVAVCGEIVA